MIMSPGLRKVALTAHVKNVGFVAAAPFDYVWLMAQKRGLHEQEARA